MTTPTQRPSVGRIVLYTVAEYELDLIQAANPGGNGVRAGDVFPAIIVRPWGDRPESACNLTVFLDGPGTYWATSRQQASGELAAGAPGFWHWPPRV